jgi:Mrp family chromosome partitioning ATPase
MTALDRAIIKAYHRPSSRPGTAVAEPPEVTPDIRSRVAKGPTVALSQALAATATVDPDSFNLEPTASVKQVPQTTPPTADPVGPSIAALLDEASQTTSVTESTAALLGPSTGALASRVFQATTVTQATTAWGGPSTAALAEQAFPVTTVTVRIPSAGGNGETIPVQSPSSPGISETMPAPAETIAAAAPTTMSASAHSVTISPQPDETPWRPLLQVDRVAWPSIHGKLQTTAAAAVQRMADSLLSICASGSKVLGLASCSRGEGVTTLMLAAARSLKGQGRKVVLVDANWSNPQLAQNLGLLPQIGWEETLCGGLPLEEVVIESLADGLAVLPVRKPSASTIAQEQIAASFDILAREFDVVLVDLGPLGLGGDDETASRDVAAEMDAVVLVQNVRVTTPNQLADVREHLAASNLRYAGTIQNFVAG